jgi:Uncharacterized protein conserved in bacteria
MTDPAKPYLVVSDLHLGVGPVERSRTFREFLRFAAEHASGLLINGDLFDVWLATRHFVVRHHVRELAAIADLVDAGVPVHLVGGTTIRWSSAARCSRSLACPCFTSRRGCRSADGARW